MSVKTTNAARAGTQVPGLGSNVTVSDDSEDTENSGNVSGHVETAGNCSQDLTEVDETIARKVAIVGKQVKTWARTSAVVWSRGLECEARLWSLVVGVNSPSNRAEEASKSVGRAADCGKETTKLRLRVGVGLRHWVTLDEVLQILLGHLGHVWEGRRRSGERSHKGSRELHGG